MPTNNKLTPENKQAIYRLYTESQGKIRLASLAEQFGVKVATIYYHLKRSGLRKSTRHYRRKHQTLGSTMAKIVKPAVEPKKNPNIVAIHPVQVNGTKVQIVVFSDYQVIAYQGA